MLEKLIKDKDVTIEKLQKELKTHQVSYYWFSCFFRKKQEIIGKGNNLFGDLIDLMLLFLSLLGMVHITNSFIFRPVIDIFLFIN